MINRSRTPEKILSLFFQEIRQFLDGTNSYDPGNNPLYYQWTQVYGPSIITFSDNQIAAPEISSLIEGYYLINLEVSNGYIH